MKKRIGVLLSGCGFLDGSEIHEAVLTLLHLDRAGAEAVCIAPDAPQTSVVNHRTQGPAAGERSMLEESARIARGRIQALNGVDPASLDGLILPGGFGAAKNLCDFATRGKDATARPDVARLLQAMHRSQKPIGAVCIAPAVVAAAMQGRGVKPKLTIGSDAGTAKALTALGSEHQDCAVTGFVVDPQNRIVSTPAYMFDAPIGEVSQGIERLVGAVLELATAPRTQRVAP